MIKRILIFTVLIVAAPGWASIPPAKEKSRPKSFKKLNLGLTKWVTTVKAPEKPVEEKKDPFLGFKPVTDPGKQRSLTKDEMRSPEDAFRGTPVPFLYQPGQQPSSVVLQPVAR